jgi:predicted lipoprotein with Yx(FWY)xxD motif
MHKTVVLFPLLALALAACGGSGGNQAASSGSSSSASAPSGGGGSASGAALEVRSTSLGKVLVDGRGRTVYMLTADSAGHSTCNASCLAYWPPVSPSGQVPQKLPGISATIGTAKLPSGGQTLTAGGWPLYTFVKDTEAGDVYGQGITNFGGTWYVVSPAGHPVKMKAPSDSTSQGRSY